MLAFKAWCESRVRFWAAIALIFTASAVFTLAEATFRSRMIAIGGPVLQYTTYIDTRVFTGVTRALFLLLAAILGLGGLARERGHGTLGFTLALPVPRWHHTLARAGVGALELAVIALVPVAIVPMCSIIVGESYSITVAFDHALAWIAAGSAVLAVAMVISVAIRNHLAALLVAVVGLRLGASAVPHGALAATGVALVAFAVAALLERIRP